MQLPVWGVLTLIGLHLRHFVNGQPSRHPGHNGTAAKEQPKESMPIDQPIHCCARGEHAHCLGFQMRNCKVQKSYSAEVGRCDRDQMYERQPIEDGLTPWPTVNSRQGGLSPPRFPKLKPCKASRQAAAREENGPERRVRFGRRHRKSGAAPAAACISAGFALAVAEQLEHDTIGECGEHKLAWVSSATCVDLQGASSITVASAKAATTITPGPGPAPDRPRSPSESYRQLNRVLPGGIQFQQRQYVSHR